MLKKKHLTIEKFDELVKEDPESLKDMLFGVDPDKLVEQQLSDLMGEPIPRTPVNLS